MDNKRTEKTKGKETVEKKSSEPKEKCYPFYINMKTEEIMEGKTGDDFTFKIIRLIEVLLDRLNFELESSHYSK
jgi:hypothetical protein